jgi:hypothetical protein
MPDGPAYQNIGPLSQPDGTRQEYPFQATILSLSALLERNASISRFSSRRFQHAVHIGRHAYILKYVWPTRFSCWDWGGRFGLHVLAQLP